MTYDLEKDRLTVKGWRNLDPWECCGQDSYCQRGCHEDGGCNKGCIVPKTYVQLAKYEDTGLTPKDIPELCARVRELEGENEQLRANSLIQGHIITAGRNPEDKDKIVNLIMENAELRADNAILLKLFGQINKNGYNEQGECRYCHSFNQIMESGVSIQEHEEWCPNVLINNTLFHFPQSGAALLKELEGLRKVAEAAQRVVKDPNGNYWDDYRVGVEYIWKLDKAMSAAQRQTHCGPGEGEGE